MNLDLKKGISFALLTTLISGFSIFFNKYAVGLITPPLFFTTMKNTGVALLIFAAIVFSRKFSQIKNLNRKELILLGLIGIIGGSVPFYLFFTGLSLVPAINAAIIQKTLVIWVALLAWPLLKEKMSTAQLAAVALLFISNIAVGGFKGFDFSKGELMIFGSTLFWAVEYMLAKKVLKSVDVDIVVMARMGVGSLILLAATFVTSAKSSVTLGNGGAFWLTLSIVLLLGYVMSWYRALKFAPATLVTCVLVGSTLVTNVLSAVFVTKTFSPIISTQSILMLVSLGFLIYSVKSQPKVTETQI